MALDTPISTAELHDALHHMTNRKAPGPDGLPTKFYKEFWTTLERMFVRMVCYIKESSKLPSDMNSANIS